MNGDWSLALAGNGDTDAARTAFKQLLGVLNAPGSGISVTSGQFTASEGVDQLTQPAQPTTAAAATDPGVPAS